MMKMFKMKIEMILNKFNIKDLLQIIPMKSERSADKEDNFNKNLIIINFFFYKGEGWK